MEGCQGAQRDERGLFSPAQKRLKGDLQPTAAVRAFTKVIE